MDFVGPARDSILAFKAILSSPAAVSPEEWRILHRVAFRAQTWGFGIRPPGSQMYGDDPAVAANPLRMIFSGEALYGACGDHNLATHPAHG